MDPAHYEKELNIQFEHLEGFIKGLKKKNITDEEREEVSNSFFQKHVVIFISPFFFLFFSFPVAFLHCLKW